MFSNLIEESECIVYENSMTSYCDMYINSYVYMYSQHSPHFKPLNIGRLGNRIFTYVPIHVFLKLNFTQVLTFQFVLYINICIYLVDIIYTSFTVCMFVNMYVSWWITEVLVTHKYSKILPHSLKQLSKLLFSNNNTLKQYSKKIRKMNE